jgi:hypothetical protein
MAPKRSSVISGPEALAEFRQGLTGAEAVGWLELGGGRVLVTLAVGVGKTSLLVNIIIKLQTLGAGYDLVVVFAPRRDILEEIRKKLPRDLRCLVLEPRPRKRCGPLDAFWAEYEATGCGMLGRELLCGSCPRRKGCPWPGQYSARRLKGVRLILATQQYLVNDPHFVERLRQLTGARRVLTLLDESNLLLRPARREVGREELRQFIAAQEAVLAAAKSPSEARCVWLERSRLIATAPTADLRGGDWSFPPFERSWALSVQRAGRSRFGPSFRFLGFDLGGFHRSDLMSRERTAAGDLRFVSPPDLGDSFVVFSGTVAPALVRYRLDPDHRLATLRTPFENVRFEHPETRWYNLNFSMGTASHFPRNSPAVLDFFAALVARNIRDGRRTLLVARKQFLGLCVEHLTRRLGELGVEGVRVITKGWDSVDLSDPRTLPLISYGIIGINLFEHFDCAYCLTGYYVPSSVIADAVQDLQASDDRFPITIRPEGEPPRRTTHVELPDDRETILPNLARWTLEQLESDVVVQAVGRVRPFTRPREVITFHQGTLPGVRYNLEFRSLEQARNYLNVLSGRAAAHADRIAEARRLKTLGLSNPEIADRMKISVRTAIRYAHKGR